MMEGTLGAQISHMLHARGVDVIFGIPGVHNVELYRGIEEAGITHILARHEQGAAFMADGYARATGRAGVCYLITGPGLTNALTALGQAQSDRVPVLAIASCLRRPDIGMGRGRLHEMIAQEDAAAAVCGWSRTATDARSAYQWVDRALFEFASGNRGARALHVPIDLLELRASAAPPPLTAPRLPVPDRAALDDAAKRIAGARRPLFVFGGGSVKAWKAARRVLALTEGASFVTMAGRGIPDPKDARAFGGYLARPDSGAVFARADLVIAVGTELSEVDIWRDALGHTAPLIRVDLDPRELSDDYRADLSVIGDAEAFLDGIAERLAPQKSSWTMREVVDARVRWRADVDAERPGVLAVADAVRRALPDDCLIYSDMTQFAYVALEAIDMPMPGLWHHPFGFGTLGYATPAAIGGKAGCPDQPVVAIAGDYGFQYTVQELGAAVELGLPLPILIWDNGKLKEIEDSMRRSQIAPNAVTARNPDFTELARAWGAAATEPATLPELEAAISTALRTRGPTVIHMTPELVKG